MRCGLCKEFVARGNPCPSVPFQLEFVFTTVVLFSIIELTNQLFNDFVARDTPRRQFTSVSPHR